MNEKRLKKVLKILNKAGVSEDLVSKVEEELKLGDDVEVVDEDEIKVEDKDQKVDEPTDEAVDKEGGEVDENAPVENGEQEVPPVDGKVDGENPEGQPEPVVPTVDEQVVNPEENAVPPAPVPEVNPLVEELKLKNDELTKSVDGLLARIGSLEDALKKAGVIEGGLSDVGHEGQPTPSASVEASSFDDVIAGLNQKHSAF